MLRSKPGWQDRYAPIWPWVKDAAGLLWVLFCIGFVFFFATWSPS